MIELSTKGLGLRDVVAVARQDAEVVLTDEARQAMADGAAIVQRLADSDEPVYGVSTGFGSLATTPIPAERRAELQRALLRSHAAGMGPPVEREVVRAMMLLRARTLAMGYSGARPEVAEAILAMLNAGLDSRRAGARLARGQRRPRSAGPLRAGPDRRRRGVRAQGRATTPQPRRWMPGRSSR